LRSELFSAVQMEQHGKDLAASHLLMPGIRRTGCWRA
jgi:cyclic beta-1,2-glucan synthetase